MVVNCLLALLIFVWGPVASADICKVVGLREVCNRPPAFTNNMCSAIHAMSVLQVTKGISFTPDEADKIGKCADDVLRSSYDIGKMSCNSKEDFQTILTKIASSLAKVDVPTFLNLDLRRFCVKTALMK